MEETDYCEFLKRSMSVIETLLEDWEHVEKEELKARVQFFQTALMTQIARHCNQDK